MLHALLLAILSDDSSGDLIRRLRAQDPQAIADLYDIYGRMLYVLILRIVRDGAVAEDLVQETFLRTWKGAHKLDETHQSVGPWITRIARNCALDYRKSPFAQRTQAVANEDLDLPSVTIENDIVSAELARLLDQAMRDLPPHCRQVIELAYYEGMSQSEIATRLAQPLGTVKSWTRAGLKRMRDAMERPSVVS
jgi:RNA polymerase sigma-70 factor (ECF subfamily)